MLEEEQDPTLPATLGRLAYSLDEPGPALAVGRLERVVVALDPGPDDEVGAELPGEVDRIERPAQCLRPCRFIGRHEPTAAEACIEVQAAREAVDVVSVECVADLVQVLRRQLLRVVKLVAVDQVSEAFDGVANTLGRRLVREFGLVAGRDESRSHRTERPDSERGLHVAPSSTVVRAEPSITGVWGRRVVKEDRSTRHGSPGAP